jgi:hypothetical protein
VVRRVAKRTSTAKKGQKTSATKRVSTTKRTRRAGPRKSTTKHAAKRHGNGCANTKKYWSGRVTRESDALDLDKGVFSLNDPKRIAASLKRSALESHRRKAEPYRSALSMLVFYINRAGKNLPAGRRRTLDQAKGELRRLFGRE